MERNHIPRQHGPVFNAPSPEQISQALDDITTGNIKDVPSLESVNTLQDANINFPITVGDRRIIDVSIGRGQPRHGAMMSSDHISRYEVEYEQPCDECNCRVTRYKYNRYHNISGSEKTYCPMCETVHSSDDWG